ncbi:hypothetical protein UlMin_032780 [Ulmus minor]
MMGFHIIYSYKSQSMLPLNVAFLTSLHVWNHDFFWESMKPDGGGNSSRELLELIERYFGSFDKFITEFKSPAATQFCSCWAWLVYKTNRDVENAVNPNPSEQDKKLAIVKSPNAVNPLVWDIFPLLTIDVREILTSPLEHLLTWAVVS